MDTNFSNQVVVIAGASAGVGRATAIDFAKRGAKLALIARGEAGLKGALADVERHGSPAAITIQADIADAAAVEAAAQRVEDELGPIDVWVNNAMVSVFAKVMDVEPDEYRRVMDVNFHGFVHGTQTALRRMLPRDRGKIIFVGSALAYRAIPLQSAYCASKHALDGFYESLRTELIADGSNVELSLVHLPAVNTPQFGWVRTRLPKHPQPVPPIFQPEVAAEAIVWASEHMPRDMNVGLPTMLTRLGNVIAPGLLDRYLARNGIDDQQTDERIDHDEWTDNLDTPGDADTDVGARGKFEAESKDFSIGLWARTNRPLLSAVGGGLAALAAATVLRARR